MIVLCNCLGIKDFKEGEGWKEIKPAHGSSNTSIVGNVMVDEQAQLAAASHRRPYASFLGVVKEAQAA